MSSVHFISAFFSPCSFNYRESQISVIIIRRNILCAFVHVSLILYILPNTGKSDCSSSRHCNVFLTNLHQSSPLFDHNVCVGCCSSHIQLQTEPTPLVKHTHARSSMPSSSWLQIALAWALHKLTQANFISKRRGSTGGSNMAAHVLHLLLVPPFHTCRFVSTIFNAFLLNPMFCFTFLQIAPLFSQTPTMEMWNRDVSWRKPQYLQD